MLLPRIRSGLPRAQPCLATIENALSNLRLSQCSRADPTETVRHSTSLAQGRANGAKDGAGKRLGAKKSGEQYVIPGNIIFRQRGTHWFPGDNCGMGRDHTIYAVQPGYVKYYRDPAKHPKRQYIGVVFERGQSLPKPPNAVSRRRLGMLAYQMPGAEDGAENSTTIGDLMTAQQMGLQGSAGRGKGQASTIHEAPREVRGQTVAKNGRAEVVKKLPSLRPGYQYRHANWEIGRAAERAAINVEPFKPGDRFTAWRKSTARKARNAERRGMRKR